MLPRSAGVHPHEYPLEAETSGMVSVAPGTARAAVKNEIVKFSFLSEFLNMPVLRAADNKRVGKLVDLAASTAQVFPRVTGVIVRIASPGTTVYIPWANVKRIVFKDHLAVDIPDGSEQAVARASENEILLRKTFLDRQIISTSGYKIVRVNDVQLLIEDRPNENTNLWAVHIDIGMRGILRRLGYLRVVNAAFRWLTDRDIKDKFVSWKNVQPTATTSVYASVELKTDASKLSEIHPADLADILEDLGAEERIALLESLDHYTAAQTFEEMQPKNRMQITELLEAPKLAAIVNEMQMDNAVDLLDACDADKRQAIYASLPADKVAELKELSRLSQFSVGSIMNTDFIVARKTDIAAEVLDRIRAESEKAEVYRYAYVVESDDRLLGVLTLRQLLRANPATPVTELMAEQPVTVLLDTHIRRVARIFFKYNFEAVPVVDDEGRIQGVVSLRDALAAVYPEIREEAAG
jgi:magnesium transporter